MRSASALLPLVLLLGAAPFASADMLMLKDGRSIEGVKIEKGDGAYTVHYKNGDVRIPEGLVRDCLVEGEGGYEPRNDEEKAKIAQGLVPFEGKWMKKAERDALVAKRLAEKKKRIEDAKAHREWRHRWMTKGTNFDFEYTIPPEIFESYKNLMETYYTVFTKKWNIQRPPKVGRLKVCFYHDYDSFLQVSGGGYGVLAYYRFMPPRELNFFYDRVAPEFTTAVMFHEANHYLTHLIDLDFDYPHCINEAFAEYYGGSKWDPVKKEMTTGGLQEGRLTEVQTDIQGGEMRSLDKYLTDQLGYEDYTWGWSFVHFMMETPKYASKFQKFYVGLAKGKDVERVPSQGTMRTVQGPEILRVFKKYMGVDDIPALEKEWYEYIKGLKLTTSRGYEEAGFAALGTGQRIKAKRFFKMAVDKGSTNPQLYERYADVLRSEDHVDEAIPLLKKGIELDPLSASLYLSLGKALRASSRDEDKTEGERMLKLARELDPDNVDLEILFDEAMQKAGGPPAGGN